jgi:hypothetical protein
MILYANRPGQAPEHVPPSDVPGAAEVHAWAVAQGYRAVSILTDEGVPAEDAGPVAWVLEMQGIKAPPPRCCYGGAE